MKYQLAVILITSITMTGCEEFLDNPPETGLSDDKLVDIPAMQALIYGAYDNLRPFIHQPALYGAAMVRDVQIRNRAEYDQFYDHQLNTSMTGWMFNQGYNALGQVNTISASNVEEMAGNAEEKNAVLGDMHFLRALVYFELNNHFALPSTGYSLPLVTEPIGVNDRISCTPTSEVKEAIETDIEQARERFAETSGVAGYYSATALAARIYFFHRKYDLAAERAGEVINSGRFIIEPDLSAPFVPGGSSREIIFEIKYNSADAESPTDRISTAYKASEATGFYILNPGGEAAQVVLSDTSDARYKAFYTLRDDVTYIDGKYPTDQMDYIYIRLAEMYLTRAESRIRANGAVTQQEVDDINILRERANPATVLDAIPAVDEALEILYGDRLRELAFELGDHYLNIRRLERGIVRIPEEGTGMKPYSEYADLLVFPFPEKEVNIHKLTRNP